MFQWLFPKEVSFFIYFKQHAAITTLAADELYKSCDAHRIKDLEHEADTITRKCKEALHTTFITPIDRDDIFRLISRMDDIIDEINAIASRLSIYKIPDVTADFHIFAKILAESVKEIEQAVNLLNNMKNSNPILKSCRQISKLESEADALLVRVLAELFEKEQDVRRLIKCKEIYESLERATDRCDDVANIIEGIILEYT